MRRVLAASIVLVALCLNTRASAELRAPANGQVLTLDAALALARARYPSVSEARAKIAQARAQLAEAWSTPFSQFSTTAGIAVAPTLRGTSIYSPNTDVALTRSLALGWQASVDGTIPLWTFGKITNTVAAAEAGVAVKEEEARKVQAELAMSVKKAYFGAMAARDAQLLVQDAARRIDKHLSQLEIDVQEERADEVSLFKMRMHRSELRAREGEARHQRMVALSGLRVLVGATGSVDVVDQPLAPPDHTLLPLEHYLTAARLYRPELRMAAKGVRARTAQLAAQNASYYPDIGLTFSGSWSQAPEIADQLNPYVRDPGNFLRYGVALGLRWKLDFVPNHARVQRLDAQLAEAQAVQRYALGGVLREVEVAYDKVVMMQERYQAYHEAVEYARRWLITVQQGLDIGAYETDEVITPAKEYALKRFQLMSATLDYRLAFAELAVATGYEALAGRP